MLDLPMLRRSLDPSERVSFTYDEILAFYSSPSEPLPQIPVYKRIPSIPIIPTPKNIMSEAISMLYSGDLNVLDFLISHPDFCPDILSKFPIDLIKKLHTTETHESLIYISFLSRSVDLIQYLISTGLPLDLNKSLYKRAIMHFDFLCKKKNYFIDPTTCVSTYPPLPKPLLSHNSLVFTDFGLFALLEDKTLFTVPARPTVQVEIASPKVSLISLGSEVYIISETTISELAKSHITIHTPHKKLKHPCSSDGRNIYCVSSKHVHIFTSNLNHKASIKLSRPIPSQVFISDGFTITFLTSVKNTSLPLFITFSLDTGEFLTSKVVPELPTPTAWCVNPQSRLHLIEFCSGMASYSSYEWIPAWQVEVPELPNKYLHLLYLLKSRGIPFYGKMPFDMLQKMDDYEALYPVIERIDPTEGMIDFAIDNINMSTQKNDRIICGYIEYLRHTKVTPDDITRLLKIVNLKRTHFVNRILKFIYSYLNNRIINLNICKDLFDVCNVITGIHHEIEWKTLYLMSLFPPEITRDFKISNVSAIPIGVIIECVEIIKKLNRKIKCGQYLSNLIDNNGFGFGDESMMFRDSVLLNYADHVPDAIFKSVCGILRASSPRVIERIISILKKSKDVDYKGLFSIVSEFYYSKPFHSHEVRASSIFLIVSFLRERISQWIEWCECNCTRKLGIVAALVFSSNFDFPYIGSDVSYRLDWDKKGTVLSDMDEKGYFSTVNEDVNLSELQKLQVHRRPMDISNITVSNITKTLAELTKEEGYISLYALDALLTLIDNDSARDIISQMSFKVIDKSINVDDLTVSLYQSMMLFPNNYPPFEMRSIEGEYAQSLISGSEVKVFVSSPIHSDNPCQIEFKSVAHGNMVLQVYGFCEVTGTQYETVPIKVEDSAVITIDGAIEIGTRYILSPSIEMIWIVAFVEPNCLFEYSYSEDFKRALTKSKSNTIMSMSSGCEVFPVSESSTYIRAKMNRAVNHLSKVVETLIALKLDYEFKIDNLIPMMAMADPNPFSQAWTMDQIRVPDSICNYRRLFLDYCKQHQIQIQGPVCIDDNLDVKSNSCVLIADSNYTVSLSNCLVISPESPITLKFIETDIVTLMLSHRSVIIPLSKPLNTILDSLLKARHLCCLSQNPLRITLGKGMDIFKRVFVNLSVTTPMVIEDPRWKFHHSHQLNSIEQLDEISFKSSFLSRTFDYHFVQKVAAQLQGIKENTEIEHEKWHLGKMKLCNGVAKSQQGFHIEKEDLVSFVQPDSMSEVRWHFLKIHHLPSVYVIHPAMIRLLKPYNGRLITIKENPSMVFNAISRDSRDVWIDDYIRMREIYVLCVLLAFCTTDGFYTDYIPQDISEIRVLFHESKGYIGVDRVARELIIGQFDHFDDFASQLDMTLFHYENQLFVNI